MGYPTGEMCILASLSKSSARIFHVERTGLRKEEKMLAAMLAHGDLFTGGASRMCLVAQPIQTLVMSARDESSLRLCMPTGYVGLWSKQALIIS